MPKTSNKEAIEIIKTLELGTNYLFRWFKDNHMKANTENVIY